MMLGLFKRWMMQGTRLVLPLLLLPLISVISAISPEPGRAQAIGNQAGLVVVHGDGRVITRCVAFSEPQISGADLLSRSGMSLVVEAGPLGLTICSVNGEGCPSTDCFCECHGTPCVYWNYYYGNADGSWTYANVGAASRQITDGDVDAWLWGESSTVPPGLTIDAICGQARPGRAEPIAVSPPAQETPVPTVPPEPAGTDPAAPTETPPPAPTEMPPGGADAMATATSSPTPPATAIVVVKTSTPAPTATAPPTATPSPAPEVQASSGDGLVVNEESAPAASDGPSTTLRPGLVQGRLGQIVAFVVVLSIVGGAFALLFRRPGGRRSGAK